MHALRPKIRGVDLEHGFFVPMELMRLTSALGHKRTLASKFRISVLLPLKADM